MRKFESGTMECKLGLDRALDVRDYNAAEYCANKLKELESVM